MNLKVTKVTQNDLLLDNLKKYYSTTIDGVFNPDNNLDKMLKIISGDSKISLRIIDWFTTNFAKKYFTIYMLNGKRFIVYNDYKLKLKAYSKKRFDPFCRYDKTMFPYNNEKYIETTIGQLNFFKWSIENKIVDYIEENYDAIERDMNTRNSASKRKEMILKAINDEKNDVDGLKCGLKNSVDDLKNVANKTRKKREELSISATKSIKKEYVEIVVKFD
jgi:hypothetical protein